MSRSPTAPRDAEKHAGASALKSAPAPLRPAHTDWLYHHLDVDGPASELAAFSDAAAGSGTIPWVLDLAQLEEDAFHTLAGAGMLSLHGAKVLAEQLRHAAARRYLLAVSRVGHSRACPLDLHALVPVPDEILSLGPARLDALTWLWEAWGTTEALRCVTLAPASQQSDDAPDGHTRLRILFWSADWTPWRALQRVQADWPGLRFTVRPFYRQG